MIKEKYLSKKKRRSIYLENFIKKINFFCNKLLTKIYISKVHLLIHFICLNIVLFVKLLLSIRCIYKVYKCKYDQNKIFK